LSSIGSPDAKVVIAVATNLAFLKPRCFTSSITVVFLELLAPAATSDLPSAVRVGFRRIEPIRDDNFPGIVTIVKIVKELL
jgi:hypothetical protein